MLNKPNTQHPTPNTQHPRSFTLIELMLVVIIIGVLAAMVMPRLVGRSEEARKAAAKSDIAAIGLALDMYEMDTGHYPKDLAALKSDPGEETGKWKGPYLKMKKELKDPWGKDYKYTPGAATGKDYTLCSDGPKENEPICNE
jgi:general secretion pathway protein G